jgi:hypothetical protein
VVVLVLLFLLSLHQQQQLVVEVMGMVTVITA